MEAIVGYLVALMLSMLGTAGLMTVAQQGVKNVQNAAVASQGIIVNKAAGQYALDNAATLVATATATVPVNITVPMLACAKYLPISYAAGVACPATPAATGLPNAFQQTWLVQVLQPTAGQLQVLVTSQGGNSVTDTKQLAAIAAQMGAEGGFVPYNNQGGDATLVNTTAQGSFGNWKQLLTNYTNPGSGHFASLLAFSNAQTNSAYLYRAAVAGQPQLNTMNTPLIMAAIFTAGNACPSVGAIAQDGSGGILQCPTGLIWTTVGGGQWKSPVANFAALPAAGNTIGDVRLTNDVQRAYAWNGAAWVPLAVDQNGNLSIPGNLSAKTLTPTLVVADGSSCAGYPSGAQAQSSITPGLTLSCQSGVWAKAQGSGGTGLHGILAPLKGKTISCTGYGVGGYISTGYAMVDANGNPFTRSVSNWPPPYDSGWVSGFSTTISNTTTSWNFTTWPNMTVIGGIFGDATCTSNWPLN